MLWFKKKGKSTDSLLEKQELKENKKAEKLAKKEYAQQQKELQKNSKELQNTAFHADLLAKVRQGIAMPSMHLPKLYQKATAWQFIPITLLIYDCYNSYCLKKLSNILQALPKNSEVFLEYLYLIDYFKDRFPYIQLKELKNSCDFPEVSGHFIATVQLTTVDVSFLKRSIAKIYKDIKEVYLFYANTTKPSIFQKRKPLPIYSTTNYSTYSQQENIATTMHTFIDMPHFCLDKLFSIYTKNIAKKIMQFKSNLQMQYKSNFLPLLLSENIAFLDNLPTKSYAQHSIKSLEEEIKNYLKLYKVFHTQIVQESQYLFFYKVIEDKLLQYYAKLITSNRVDRLEKFDSALQKNYFVFYIGLAEHSPMRCIQKLRKKHYKVDFITKFFAKQILASANKACK